MTNKTLLLLLLFCVSLFSNSFNSSQEQCIVEFKKRGGIYFKNEEANNIGEFSLVSKNHAIKKIPLEISSITKSENLRNISNSKIYIIFNKTNKYRLSNISHKKIYLKKGLNKMHIKINKTRADILEGTAKIDFIITTKCK